MRIALVAPTYLTHRDGLKRRVEQLAFGLATRGAEVEILTQRPIRGERHSILRRGVSVRSHPTVVGRLSFPVAPGLYRSLRVATRRFDVVDLHTGYAPLILAAGRAGARRPILTPFGATHRLTGRAYASVARAAVDSCSQVICSSGPERELLGERFPGASDRLRMVRPGVDVAALDAARPFADSPGVVLAVGPLTRSNRIDRAIAAMGGLDSSWRLVVLGEGLDRRRLQAYAADLRLSSRVEFAGPVSDSELYRWLRTARAVVALADETASGLEILEAVTAGAPLVASDTPVHRDAVARFPAARVAFVSPEASPLRVAHAIGSVEHHVRPSPNGFRPRPWEAMVSEIWDLYRHLVTGPHPGTQRHRGLAARLTRAAARSTQEHALHE